MQVNSLLPRFIYLGNNAVSVYGVLLHFALLLFAIFYWRKIRKNLPHLSPGTVIGTIIGVGYFGIPVLCYLITGKFGNSAYLSLTAVAASLFLLPSLSTNDVLFLGDLAVVPGTFAFAIMKLGCLAAGCCYGLPSFNSIYASYSMATGEPFIPKVLSHHSHWEGAGLIPIQLWTALWVLVLSYCARWLERKRVSSPGVFAASALAIYAAGRLMIDNFSGDPRQLFGVHPNFLMGGTAVIGCLIFLIQNARRLKAAEV